jgi:hypothetical protein
MARHISTWAWHFLDWDCHWKENINHWALPKLTGLMHSGGKQSVMRSIIVMRSIKL